MDTVPHDAPDQIGPDVTPKQTFGEKMKHIVHSFTTKFVP
jgi:hypothetical protein